MFNRSDLKAKAKEQIKGNIGILFVCALLIFLIIGAAGITFIGPVLIAPAFFIGMIMIYLNLTKNQKPEVGDIFKGFNLFGKALWLTIITGFFISLWSILLYIPGIIKAISYSMAPYILAENPNMTAREALNESKRITNGHKMDLFVLELSFIGWGLLVFITAGIAAIYVAPYMQATMTNAYNAIKGQSQEQPQEI